MRAHFLQKIVFFLLVHNSEFLENLIKNYCIRPHNFDLVKIVLNGLMRWWGVFQIFFSRMRSKHTTLRTKCSYRAGLSMQTAMETWKLPVNHSLDFYRLDSKYAVSHTRHTEMWTALIYLNKGVGIETFCTVHGTMLQQRPWDHENNLVLYQVSLIYPFHKKASHNYPHKNNADNSIKIVFTNSENNPHFFFNERSQIPMSAPNVDIMRIIAGSKKCGLFWSRTYFKTK